MVLVVENQYVTRLIIWFREDFKNYLSNSGDERTQSTSAAVERWVSSCAMLLCWQVIYAAIFALPCQLVGV